MRRRAPARSGVRHLLDPRRWLIALGGALLVVLAPMMARAQAAPDSVTLQWTAPGDDGTLGLATLYHMKYSISPINSGNWALANEVPGMPTPMTPGSKQTVVVRGLSRDTTYYFAIRAEDDAGNLALISNVVTWDWVYDTAPPAAPTGVTAVKASGSVQVTWNANSEPDLQGYSVYRATAAGGPYTKVTSSLVTSPNWLDTSPPAVSDVWYEVSASDVSDNEGARSAAFHLVLSSPAPPAAVTDALAPVYPNPSHAGQPVCMPLSVNGTGAGLWIDIVNGGGFRIRRLDVASAPRCPDNSVRWDGRNDAGAEVAPGVYRAWLVDGDQRTSVKLVRQP